MININLHCTLVAIAAEDSCVLFPGDSLVPLLLCKGSAHRWPHYESIVEVAARTLNLGFLDASTFVVKS